MKPAVSKPFIAVVCVICAAGAMGEYFAPQAKNSGNAAELAAPVRPKDPQRQAQAVDAPAKGDLRDRIKRLAMRAPQSDVGDLFAADIPPPVAQPQPKRLARAAAPAFPFTYMGALQDGDARVVFLTSADDRVITARANQTIDGVYRIEHIDAHTMTVNYLPLHQSQSIPLDRLR
jgi:hypothetical protein